MPERLGPYELGRVHCGDCLDGMAALPADSVDSIVTDPPYGLTDCHVGGDAIPGKFGERTEEEKLARKATRERGGFMGMKWDRGVPGVAFWQAALRVSKPGAHLLAFGGTRTFHRLACAIEDAGWEIRDCIMWVYGSGFPKSLDVSKAIDKAAGAAFESRPASGVGFMNAEGAGGYNVTKNQLRLKGESTPAAKLWAGWGTALKPAWEPIIVARKPLIGTVAENVLKHGTGAMNIDGCRIETQDNLNGGAYSGGAKDLDSATSYATGVNAGTFKQPAGRWPANLVHDGSPEVLAGFPESQDGVAVRHRGVSGGRIMCRPKPPGTPDAGYGGSGSAARFFYCAKASRSEREAGMEGYRVVPAGERAGGRAEGSAGLVMADGKANPYAGTNTPNRNPHPTVKPISLMRWLVRLVTPPGGLVLDPFAGSGSTLCAAVLEGFNPLGFDMEAEYVAIANARIDYWRKHPEGPAYEPDAPEVCAGQGQLFGDEHA